MRTLPLSESAVHPRRPNDNLLGCVRCGGSFEDHSNDQLLILDFRGRLWHAVCVDSLLIEFTRINEARDAVFFYSRNFRSKYKIGDRVRTIAVLKPRDYVKEAQRRRRANVVGFVVESHDSHGLCYDVQHEDDNSIGVYDPDEIRPEL